METSVAAVLELRRRGHEVRLADPPDLVRFVQSAGLAPVACSGPDSHGQLEAEVFRKGWSPGNPFCALHQARHYLMQGWTEMRDTFLLIADGADEIFTGTTYQELATNIVNATGLPLAALHYSPFWANNKILPLQTSIYLAQPLWAIAEWAHCREACR